MDIKRLLTRGGQVFAAEIVDGSEHYNVFYEALGNNVILPELIASGWDLITLPLGLRKDGIAIDELPRMEYSPSVDEEQDMYDLLGTEMPMGERRKYLSESKVDALKMAAGNYRIQTREELLEYLKSIGERRISEDFLPLNYFVHPNALFSLDEYMHPSNSVYVQIIESRRTLSLPQFLNLRAWALANGLRQDFTALDFLSFYFQWGICGLRVSLLTRKTQAYYIMQDIPAIGADMSTRTPYINDFALIDRFQKAYRRPGTENYTYSDERLAANVARYLNDGVAGVVKIRKQTQDVVEEWETVETNISFCPRYLKVGERKMTSLRAHGKYGFIAPRHWNPSTDAEMNNDMFLHAIAHDYLDKRRMRADVSSYKALIESGCSPLSAIVYVLNHMGEEEVDPLDVETQKEPVTVHDVMNYLDGLEVAEDKAMLISGIMDGEVNIDKVAIGIQADARNDTDTLYSQLYCIHHILGVPTREIYKELSNFETSSLLTEKGGKRTMNFTNGEIVVEVRADPIKSAYDAYNLDIAKYRLEQAKTATNFMWVETVARELGSEEADRHVAVQCYTAVTNRKFEAVLSSLEEVYRAKVDDAVADPKQSRAYLEVRRLFAIKAFFSGALRGFYNFESDISTELVKVDPELREEWRSLISGPLVDDTLSIANNAIYFSDASWHWHCVNAVVRADKVTPRQGAVLRETSLAAVWNDVSHLPIHQELKKRGLVRDGDRHWSLLSKQQPVFLYRGDTDMSLTDYYEEAKKYVAMYDKTKKLVAVPHLLELRYPFFAKDDASAPAAGPDESYKFKVGKSKTLTYKAPELKKKVEEYVPIQQFIQLTAEDFFFTGGNIQFPTRSGKTPVIVLDPYTLSVNGNVIRPADVANLDPAEYQVSHLHGRKYLVCDHTCRYWTVRC